MHRCVASLLIVLFYTVRAHDGRATMRTIVEKQRLLSEVIEYHAEQCSAFGDYETLINESTFSASSFFNVISASELQGLSTECNEDLSMIVQTMKDPNAYPGFLRTALMKMLDSSGKKGPAILKGHNYFVGHFSECNDLDYEVQGRDRHFRGQYFRVDIDPFFRPNSRDGSCVISAQNMTAEVFWEVGLCLPASCSSAELMELVRPETGASIDNPVCRIARPGDLTPEIDAGFYITLSIMGAIVAVCIVSGFIDFYFSEKLKKMTFSKSLGWQIFMSFSLYTNIASIFDLSEANKTGQIGPLHCIRFFSMVWVLLSHLVTNSLSILANSLDIVALAPDLTSEVFFNGYFSVDSFFFMSGVLLTFLWFKMFARAPKQVMSARSWVMYYVHRVLRLSPPFYFMVLFTTFVIKQIYKYTPFSMNPTATTDYCRETWWLDMLYIHNWVDHKEWCTGHTWYLASEMQMFLFTPLIIIPLALKPILGLIVAAGFLAISTGINIFLVYYYHWPTSENYFYTHDPLETNLENYEMIMYDSPVIRCQIYIMGMLVGWFLHTKKHLNIHPIIYLSAWILGVSIMLTALLGLHDQTNGFYIPIFWRAMYSSLCRPAWGVGLSVIVILCYYGYGGPINSFMSWHIWIPLGRLSYSGYLIHMIVIQLSLSLSQDEIYFSNFLDFFITRVISYTVVTYFFATFWSACFEISFGRLEKLLLGGVRAASKIEEKSEITKEEITTKEKDYKTELRL